VLVTHHVEEIMPVFTHALMLAGGRVTAAGSRERVLNSRVLSQMFGSPVRLGKRRQRLHLDVLQASAHAM
jgi:iron complex transport system ATP-binding protein